LRVLYHLPQIALCLRAARRRPTWILALAEPRQGEDSCGCWPQVLFSVVLIFSATLSQICWQLTSYRRGTHSRALRSCSKATISFHHRTRPLMSWISRVPHARHCPLPISVIWPPV